MAVSNKVRWNVCLDGFAVIVKQKADALIAMAKRVDSCSEFVEALQEGNHAN